MKQNTKFRGYFSYKVDVAGLKSLQTVLDSDMHTLRTRAAKIALLHWLTEFVSHSILG